MTVSTSSFWLRDQVCTNLGRTPGDQQSDQTSVDGDVSYSDFWRLRSAAIVPAKRAHAASTGCTASKACTGSNGCTASKACTGSAVCSGFLRAAFLVLMAAINSSNAFAAAGLVAASTLLTSAAIAADQQAADEPVAEKPVAVDTRARRETQLRDHLAAGEYAAAVQTALTADDLAERRLLLREIMAAQAAGGDQAAAAATFRAFQQQPLPPGAAAGSNPQRPGTGWVDNRPGTGGFGTGGLGAGGRGPLGGTGANYGPLIDLIQTTISPESWSDSGGSGAIQPFDTGVRVDATGKLQLLSTQDKTNRLRGIRHSARAANLSEQMTAATPLRFISLRKLSNLIEDELRLGRPIPETARRMGGLQRLQFVAIDPESGDLLVGGPAGPWRRDENGLAVDAVTGAPCLDLDDFVTLFRTFEQKSKNVFGCQINPRAAGLKAVNDKSEKSRAAGPLAPREVAGWVNDLRKTLGDQDVVVYGVPANSRVANVIVRADYRMKLIGVGLHDPGIGLPNYFDLLDDAALATAQSMAALRWWMSPQYTAVLHDEQQQMFELQNASVLLQSEDEFVTAQGKRVHTGKSTGANKQFARNFTANYAALSRRDPVFAELQNVFDAALVAAIIHEKKLLQKTNWDGGVFASSGAMRTQRHTEIKTVESVVNHRVYKRGLIVVQVAGGVTGDMDQIVSSPEVARQIDDGQQLPSLPARNSTSKWFADGK